jgi:hypothetical protein
VIRAVQQHADAAKDDYIEDLLPMCSAATVVLVILAVHLRHLLASFRGAYV